MTAGGKTQLGAEAAPVPDGSLNRKKEMQVLFLQIFLILKIASKVLYK